VGALWRRVDFMKFDISMRGVQERTGGWKTIAIKSRSYRETPSTRVKRASLIAFMTPTARSLCKKYCNKKLTQIESLRTAKTGQQNN
jgi:hypothetical protein